MVVSLFCHRALPRVNTHPPIRPVTSSDQFLPPKTHIFTRTHRSEYALAGDVVNLAARLAAASEKEGDGALCDERTLESLTGVVSTADECVRV